MFRPPSFSLSIGIEFFWEEGGGGTLRECPGRCPKVNKTKKTHVPNFLKTLLLSLFSR